MKPLSKVIYRPIEAAIRWSCLTRHEMHILGILNGRQLPEPNEFPKWPALRLNAERIYDGIANHELRVAINGIAIDGEDLVDRAEITIRHVDLKAWMGRFYPAQRPPFLFTRLEREVQPFLSVDAARTLLLERETPQQRIEQREHEIRVLRREAQPTAASLTSAPSSETTLSLRSEMTYLHIIGALLGLILGQSPSGQPYSRFRTQEAVISTLLASYEHRLGITQRTLEAKFAAARRTLSK